MSWCVCVSVMVERECVCIFTLCVFIACCSDSDSLERSKLGDGRFEYMPIMDPIDRRFKDRFMG